MITAQFENAFEKNHKHKLCLDLKKKFNFKKFYYV
jgi:hypothetical protein